MKRIAAIYDIHGNLSALEAVLRDFEADTLDLVIVGGDVAAGPLPGETIDRLRMLPLPARFVCGNADRELVEAYDGMAAAGFSPEVEETAVWAAQQLTRKQRDFLAGFEPTVPIAVDGLGEVLFYHASPRSDTELFTVKTSDERLLEIFAGVRQAVVVCGHTHMQFDRQVGATHLINAGSVGMPYGEPDAELRRTPYNLQAAAARIRRSSYPLAADFAASNILHPPTAAEALAVFEP